jgi:hypothetical protein
MNANIFPGGSSQADPIVQDDTDRSMLAPQSVIGPFSADLSLFSSGKRVDAAQNDYTAFGVFVGARVKHRRALEESSGIVIEVDSEAGDDITTCRVVWDARTLDEALGYSRADSDIVWTNKLVCVEADSLADAEH